MAFLRDLLARGLKGVELVISDAYEGLRRVIDRVLAGGAWQPCRVHFMCNVLVHVPKEDKSIVEAAIRTIFAQANQGAAHQQLAKGLRAMESRWPTAGDLRAAGEQELFTCVCFPREDRTRTCTQSTNPLERLSKEVKRGTNVVDIFRKADALLRRVGWVLSEINDEWQVG